MLFKRSTQRRVEPLLIADEKLDLIQYLFAQYDFHIPANIRNFNGDALLHIALSKFRHRENMQPQTVARLKNIINLLFKIGADPNAKNASGYTPLMFAVGLKNPEIVKLLLDNGADKAIKNHKGEDALFIAKETGIQSLTALLSTGPDNKLMLVNSK